VEWTNGGHFDDLPCQEFDPVIFGEDPGLTHTVILVNGETVCLQHNGHGLPPHVSGRISITGAVCKPRLSAGAVVWVGQEVADSAASYPYEVSAH
jgi:hypothetical protein